MVLACSWQESTAKQLGAITSADVDAAVEEVLRERNVPGASIALVSDGRIVYRRAYGAAQLSPRRPATTAMRFAIGSVSKQFVAAAALMLEGEGRVSLDKPVSTYHPDVGAAGRATLRQLLSHTSGLREHMPQDYVTAKQLEPVEPLELVSSAAGQEPDFAAGERWRYSNTGYVLAGLVLEAVERAPLMDILRRRIFDPLGMSSVIDIDRHPLAPEDAVGYSMPGLAEPELATKMASGWLFAAGGLAMTAEDLARWNLALIDHRLMAPTAQRAMQVETLLNNGVGTRYGLGLVVTMRNDRPVLLHDGGVPGFGATSVLLPEQRMAIVVLVNADYGETAPRLASMIQRMLLDPVTDQDQARTLQDRQVLLALQAARVDRDLFTANANAYFSERVLVQTARALQGAGALKRFSLRSRASLGGLDERHYVAEFERQRYAVVTRAWPDSRLEQFTISRD